MRNPERAICLALLLASCAVVSPEFARDREYCEEHTVRYERAAVVGVRNRRVADRSDLLPERLPDQRAFGMCMRSLGWPSDEYSPDLERGLSRSEYNQLIAELLVSCYEPNIQEGPAESATHAFCSCTQPSGETTIVPVDVQLVVSGEGRVLEALAEPDGALAECLNASLPGKRLPVPANAKPLKVKISAVVPR